MIVLFFFLLVYSFSFIPMNLIFYSKHPYQNSKCIQLRKRKNKKKRILIWLFNYKRWMDSCVGFSHRPPILQVVAMFCVFFLLFFHSFCLVLFALFFYFFLLSLFKLIEKSRVQSSAATIRIDFDMRIFVFNSSHFWHKTTIHSPMCLWYSKCTALK